MEFRKILYFFSKLWRAIPDVLGRQLNEAGGGRGTYPSLIAKYELDIVETDRDNDVTKW